TKADINRKLSCLTSTKLKLFILESNPRRYPHANVIPYVNEIYSPSLVSDALPLSLADETNPILLTKADINRKLSCLTSTKLKLFILESNPRRYPHANVIPYVNEIYSPSL
ncbi:20685_t:CDS:2, partial [Entrophospora sp. SA101]